MIESATAAALNGIVAAQNSAAVNTDRITRFAGDTVDLVQPLTGLMAEEQQLEASVVSIRTDDQFQQSLLNILA